MKRKAYKANISLITVIITGTVLFLSGVTVLLGSIDLAKATKNSVSHELNMIRSTSCVEESLNKLKFDKTYLGTFQINYSDGNCQGTISADPLDPTNMRLVAVTSTKGDYVYHVYKKVDISSKPYRLLDP